MREARQKSYNCNINSKLLEFHNTITDKAILRVRIVIIFWHHVFRLKNLVLQSLYC